MREIILGYETLQETHIPPYEFLRGVAATSFDVPSRVSKVKELLEATMAPESLQCCDLSEEVILSVHGAGMIRMLQGCSVIAEKDYRYPRTAPRFPGRNYDVLEQDLEFSKYCLDTCSPIRNDTWKVAQSSASLAYSGALALQEKPTALVYVLTRPPGHHAGREYFGGYCYLNNAAIAARSLRKLGRGAIVDVDFHHGNGTQDIVGSCEELRFLSLHGDPATNYPFSTGFAEERGLLGNIWNVPLPNGTSGEDYLLALDRKLSVLEDSKFIVISLGLDTYIDDPTGSFRLNVDDFYRMGQRFAQIGCPTMIVHEGGYCVAAIPELVAAFLRGFE